MCAIPFVGYKVISNGYESASAIYTKDGSKTLIEKGQGYCQKITTDIAL